MANETNTSNNGNSQQPAVEQSSPSWPSVNTSTSENMNRLQISKSEDFDRITKKHFKKK